MARARTERRKQARQAVKDATERLRLAELLPGGSPSRPIRVATSHLVELEATTPPCVACGGSVRCDAHEVEWHGGGSLRVARVRCVDCRVRRNVYFEVAIVS